jgi:MFS family permease
MFLSAIVLALIVGAFAGGGLPRLADLKLRWLWVLALALLLRVSATVLRDNQLGAGLPTGLLYIGAYFAIFVWLWGNWRVPGLQIASVGIGANTLAVILNVGQMPIWSAAFRAAGFTAGDIANDPFHFILQADTLAEFVARGGLFGDVIPLPIPIIRDVVSIGDVILALGIFWAIVYSMTRPHAPLRATLAAGASAIRPAPASAFGSGVALAGAAGGAAAIPAQLAVSAPPATAEARPQSPYLRLVANRNFSLLWVGQLISLLGDRIHVVALAFLVYARGSPLEVGLTFAATAVPNVLLGPFAGALVDRWDRRVTMIGCDLVRGALVLSVPFAIEIHIGLVYLASFLIATVTLLFRPAKTAIIPAVVGERDLMTANSAISVSDTAADLLGFPVAGVIVASLSAVIGAAFVLDASTYVVSAVLLWAMVVPRQVETRQPMRPRAIWDEMVEGWRFLRRQTELFANTLVSAVAQLAVGAEIVVSVVYAEQFLDQTRLPYPQNYSLLLAAVGLGSVIGGLGIGWIGERIPKGPMAIAGFIGMGLTLIAAGLVTDPFLAIAIFFLMGAANMLFIIPSITLFQERTPQRLMGRVVSTRQALVFGSIALAMALSGWLAGVIGPAPVLIVFGGICAAAGAVGILVPAMRDAR